MSTNPEPGPSDQLTEEHRFYLKKSAQRHEQNKVYWDKLFTLIKWIVALSSIIGGLPQVTNAIISGVVAP